MATTFKKIIFDDLRSRGLSRIIPKIKSVRYETFSGGDSVHVKAVNLFKTHRESLNGLLKQYQHGYFDGMTDMYNYTKSDKPRSAKFVSLHNEFTDDIKQLAIKELRDEWGIIDDKTAQEKKGMWYDQCVYQLLNSKEEGDIWQAQAIQD